MSLFEMFEPNGTNPKSPKTAFLNYMRQFGGRRTVPLFNIKLGRHVYFIGHVLSVLFPLFYTFGQQIFDLSVYRTEVVLCPGSNGVIKLCG